MTAGWGAHNWRMSNSGKSAALNGDQMVSGRWLLQCAQRRVLGRVVPRSDGFHRRKLYYHEPVRLPTSFEHCMFSTAHEESSSELGDERSNLTFVFVIRFEIGNLRIGDDIGGHSIVPLDELIGGVAKAEIDSIASSAPTCQTPNE